MEKHDLKMEHIFSAPREKVFAAWMNKEELPSWFGPGPMKVTVHEYNPQVGGSYHITMTSPEGNEHIVKGEFKEVREPEKLVFTWRWEGGDGIDTLVTVHLEEEGGKTKMLFEHTGFDTEEGKVKHGEGWGAIFANLEKQL